MNDLNHDKTPWSQTEKISKCWRIEPFLACMFCLPFSDHLMVPQRTVPFKSSPLLAHPRAYVCIFYEKTKRKLPWEHHVVWNGKIKHKPKSLLQPRATTALVTTEFSSEMWESLKGTTLLHYLFRRQVFHSAGYLVRVVYKIWYIQSYLWVTCSRSPGCFINISLAS